MGSENSFYKYPKVKRIGFDENAGILEQGHLVVKEKLDGANFRFTWDEDQERIVFGSRNVEYWDEKDTSDTFVHAIEYVRENADIEKIAGIQSEHDGRVVYYGEAMHSHTLPYGEPNSDGSATTWKDVENFIGFDVMADGERMSWDSARTIFNDVGLPYVETYYEGDADGYELPDPEDMPDSFYRDGIPEGVVIINEDTGQVAKHRSTKFKEKHDTQSVTNPDDYDPDDSITLARQFTTEARVLKMIHKYEDRGETIEMGIMDDLWRDVFDDIIEEEYETIFLGNYDLNTKDFRSEIASLTANVLETYLERPEGSVLNE